MTNQEELEEIIFNAIMDDLTKETREYLAKYILDRGFVKKDSIELDEEKIAVLIRNWIRSKEDTKTLAWFENPMTVEEFNDEKKLAHAIAQAGKEIVK